MSLIRKIRILIVEDSFVKRELLKSILATEPAFEIVKAVGTGESAVDFIKTNEVDMITMDINLPGIDGFDTIRKILAIRKTPIVIVSAIREKYNEEILLKAMRENGALAFLDSPPPLGDPRFAASTRRIIATIRALSEVPKEIKANDSPETSIVRVKYNFAKLKLIIIGVSTGGPIVIEQILSGLPQDFPVPIVIVQHILKGFEDLLINTLQKTCKIKIKLAEDKECIKKSVVYIAPADKKIGLNSQGVLSLLQVPDDSLILNTVSYLFASAASSYSDKVLAILLTGMGKDGAAELKHLKNLGAYTIAQNKESSAIYGMPGEAARINAAIDIMPPREILDKLLQINETIKASKPV